MTLVKFVKKIYTSLKNHIGSGDDAHLTATKQNNGFMSYEDKIKVDGASIILDKGTDILTLKTGFYSGFNLVNSPTTTGEFLQIVVLESTDANFVITGRKQIWVTRTYRGETYYRTTHTDGTHESGTGGWHKVLTNYKDVYTREYLPVDTDILTLPGGRYEGHSLINSPTINPEIASIDVIEGVEGRKQIWVNASNRMSGTVYFRTIHTGGSPQSGTGGWKKFEPTDVDV